ncbi:hypothetical protein STRAU_2011 [Streptomyces aurantiacus JA 4570]|uniref:Uncharacterized protein n=1 Tax=Streptomyces aurantiacus JA 4570 TaxID=1286094 RepID=S3ZQ21_9ACTN|nr:hypothetical protein STRAU_2011 [Streptomyces aurantiacus JA 4570]
MPRVAALRPENVTLRTGNRLASGIPAGARASGACTERNPTITAPARENTETPPFATPSNELPARSTRFT